MNRHLLTLVLLLLAGTTRTLAHGGVELGPNGGRILEFSTDESLHGELVFREGRFTVRLLDRDMKPVELKDQVLTVVGGSRSQPERPQVTRSGDLFGFPALKGDRYELVLRLKADPKAKTVTARVTYDAETCSGCNNPEWLCKCPPEKP